MWDVRYGMCVKGSLFCFSLHIADRMIDVMTFFIKLMLIAVVIGALRHGERLGWALEARALGGEGARRTTYRPLSFHRGDYLVFAILLIILAGAMDAALLHLGVRRGFRWLGRDVLDLGFSRKPVFKVLPRGVATLCVTVVRGLANHRLALLKAECPSPGNVRIALLLNRCACLSGHVVLHR